MRKSFLLFTILAVATAGLAQAPAPDQPSPQKPAASDSGSGFSEEIVNRLLGQLKKGFEGRNEHRVLAAFDAERMDGYLEFQDQVGAFLQRYDPIRIYYRVAQTSTESGQGIALVEMQMEADPADGNGPPVRRDRQVRFEFVRGKEWKIVAIEPREFFAP